MTTIRILLVGAAFVAATLQGSRLPQPEPGPAESLALRAGSGADPAERPSLRDGVLA
jgi:hypothetical protein